ncbi:MAG TPA: MarR family transcriptional regulator [Sedimenticola thiotaurini]|uniref:MarR family transcriptional regulator n=1 Tax=Sedimenticola thiotaurini TaxID=1543721 RepID=A0A831RKI4_9GAMM|nr:MarR family transcriptional regulator [Sedimenticola thiotaurini]
MTEQATVKLERFMPYRLSVLSIAISRGISELYSERFGISIMEWRVIAVLGNYQPLSSSDICRHTSMDKVQVSRAVAGLSRSGLVLRRTDSGDRRRSLLRLSARGQRVYRKIVPLALEWEQKLMQALSPREQALFDRLLQKLEQRVRQIQDT